jgi:hypothetical protein
MVTVPLPSELLSPIYISPLEIVVPPLKLLATVSNNRPVLDLFKAAVPVKVVLTVFVREVLTMIAFETERAPVPLPSRS